MKKGIIGSILAVALLSGIAYANTTPTRTTGTHHVAAMHGMSETGKMMYDRDCAGMTETKRQTAQDRQPGGVLEDKLDELQQEIMR